MTDVFRSQYRELTDLEKATLFEMKSRADLLWNMFDLASKTGADGRMIALAKTNLEQSVMWAVKAVTG